MESQVAIKDSAIGCFHSAWISDKHFSENIMAEEQLIDGSNAFILDALLPTEEQAKENNTVQVKLEFSKWKYTP